jgi:hypothetical protein
MKGGACAEGEEVHALGCAAVRWAREGVELIHLLSEVSAAAGRCRINPGPRGGCKRESASCWFGPAASL